MSRFMRHWNQCQLCAIDVETSGLDPFYHEVLQICILPLDSEIEPMQDIMPFSLNLRPWYPERVDDQALKINKLVLSDLMLNGTDKDIATDLLEEWVNKLDLSYTKWGTRKRILPLGQVYSFDKPFIQNWIGATLYNEIFDQRHRDTCIASLYVNDYLAYHAEKVAYNKNDLTWLASTLKVERIDSHSALGDCLTTAKVYKEMLKKGFIL